MVDDANATPVLTSFGDGFKTLIFGATGAIGGALSELWGGTQTLARWSQQAGRRALLPQARNTLHATFPMNPALRAWQRLWRIWLHLTS